MVPIWEKYMLTVDEAVQYFGIGEKKIRMLISENTDTDYCFTVQVGNKSLINRHKFEEFLNQTTSFLRRSPSTTTILYHTRAAFTTLK